MIPVIQATRKEIIPFNLDRNCLQLHQQESERDILGKKAPKNKKNACSSEITETNLTIVDIHVLCKARLIYRTQYYKTGKTKMVHVCICKFEFFNVLYIVKVVKWNY